MFPGVSLYNLVSKCQIHVGRLQNKITIITSAPRSLTQCLELMDVLVSVPFVCLFVCLFVSSQVFLRYQLELI